MPATPARREPIQTVIAVFGWSSERAPAVNVLNTGAWLA